jgi:hypothetical protein
MPSIDIRKGRQIPLGYAKESVRLTGEANMDLPIPWTDLTLTPMIEKIEDTSGIGNLEPLINTHKRLEAIEGSIGGFLNSSTIGSLLFHIYGSVTSVQDGTTGAYTHIFDLANTVSNPTFSLFYDLEGSWKRSRGCQLKSLNVEASEGGEVKYTSDFMGIEESNIASQTYTIPSVSNILTASNMVFKMADNVAGLTSGTEYKIMNVSVPMDRGTTYDTSYNNGFNNDVLQNGFITEVTATLKMRTDDFYTLFKDKTNKAVSIKFGGLNLPVIGTSTLKPSVEFIIASTSIFDYQRGISTDEYITFDITLKPEFDATAGFSLRTILINGVASY